MQSPGRSQIQVARTNREVANKLVVVVGVVVAVVFVVFVVGVFFVVSVVVVVVAVVAGVGFVFALVGLGIGHIAFWWLLTA